MSKPSGVYRAGGIRRIGKISRVLINHGFGDLVDRMLNRSGDVGKVPRPKGALFKSRYPSPQRIRRVLEELGPSFVKLGQLMSTRADLFPTETIDELKKLQDRVPPIPYEEIREVVEDELDCPLETVFETFSVESLAAASVAQVHKAKLKTGEEVAVKVIRPRIEKIIRQDIRLMYYFADKIEKSFELGKVVGAVNLVKEFERTIFRELDMHIEAGNIERFGANFADSDEIVIPSVYWEHTTKSVLVMQYIPGIRMDEVETIRSHGIDPKEVAMVGLRSFSRQLMEFGFFHADPHPANTIVMFDGRVSLVDFGIIGYLDEEVMRQIANLFLGYAEHDYDMVMEALWDAGLVDEETMDLESLRIDLQDISEPFYGRSLKTISVKDVYDQVMQLVMKYHIRMPRNLLLLFKTFIQTEALGKILDSDASILEVTRPYARRLLQRGYEAQRLFRTFQRDVIGLSSILKGLPRVLHDILKNLARGRQRIEVHHGGFEGMDTQFEKGINRLTVGIVIAASIIAAALVLNSSQKVLAFSFHLFGSQTVTVTGLLGLMGYSIATVLGILLIVQILRSGKL
jgi:ubiquinone biosynthesis protein